LNHERETCLGPAARLLCAGAAVPVSAASKPLPPLTPAKHDALFRALKQGHLTESQYALERARSIFALQRVGSDPCPPPQPALGDLPPPSPSGADPLPVRRRALAGEVDPLPPGWSLDLPRRADLGLRRGAGESVRRRPAALLPLGRQLDEPRLAPGHGHEPSQRHPRPDRPHDRSPRPRLGHRDWSDGLPPA